MYFFLILLKFAPLAAGSYIIQFFPEALHAFLTNFAVSFYVIVSYHLMGCVILQYHERIGYHVDYEDFTDPAIEPVGEREIDPDEPIIIAVNPLIQDGKLDEAIALIK